LPAVIITLLATHKYGPGIDNDGTFYLLFGETLAKHFNLFHYDDAFKGVWPPFYPIIIASLKFTSINIITAIGILNTVLYAGTLMLAYLSIDPFISNKKLVSAYMIVLLLSFPVFSIFTKVLSDTLFIFLFSALLYFIIQLEIKYSSSIMFLLVLCMALIPLDRYAGIFCNIAVIGYLLLKLRDNRQIQKKIIWISIIAFLPIMLWMIRNYFFIHHTTGVVAKVDLQRILFFGYNSMNEWILPHIVPAIMRSIIFDGLVLGCCIIIWKWRKIFDKMLFIPVFFIAYSVALTLIWKPEYMEYRYLSPAFIPFLATIFIILDKVNSRFVRLSMFFALLCLFTTQFFTTVLFITYRFYLGGGGFNTNEWQSSQIAGYLRNNRLTDTTYTNEIGACQYFNDHFATGIKNTDLQPPLPENSRHVSSKGNLVLFNNGSRDILNLSKFNFGSFNYIIRSTLRDTVNKDNVFFGLSQEELLKNFATNNNLVYTKRISLADGSIYYFTKVPEIFNKNVQ